MPRSRKEETRRRILQSAWEVFVQVGYERATLVAISEKADVHIQTLTLHFRTKAELMTASHIRYIESFERNFLAREGTALQFWRQWITSLEHRAEILVYPQDNHRFPILTPEAQQVVQRGCQVVAEGFAEDMGVNPAVDTRPILIALMVIHGIAHITHSLAGKRFNNTEYVASLHEVIDVAEDLVNAPTKQVPLTALPTVSQATSKGTP